jgi:hypothetical protein
LKKWIIIIFYPITNNKSRKNPSIIQIAGVNLQIAASYQLKELKEERII